MSSKYVGMVLDAKWEVIASRHDKEANRMVYTLRNQFNNYEVDISDEMIRKIVEGKSSVSRIIAYRIKQERKGKYVGVWKTNVDTKVLKGN